MKISKKGLKYSITSVAILIGAIIVMAGELLLLIYLKEKYGNYIPALFLIGIFITILALTAYWVGASEENR